MNTMGPLTQSYYDLLDGPVSVDVFKQDAPSGRRTNYVLVRAESEAEAGNKRSIANESAVIIDIVTFHEVNIDTTVANGIAGEVKGLIKPTSGAVPLTQTSGMQILNLEINDAGFLQEEDNELKIYRIILRCTQRVLQTA